MKDEEIKGFFDKFIFNANTPNEYELTGIPRNEVEKRDLNIIDYKQHLFSITSAFELAFERIENKKEVAEYIIKNVLQMITPMFLVRSAKLAFIG